MLFDLLDLLTAFVQIDSDCKSVLIETLVHGVGTSEGKHIKFATALDLKKMPETGQITDFTAHARPYF